jgi:hypothetical protein
MNSYDGIVVGRLANKFRATLWEQGEAVLWAEGPGPEEAVAALNARMIPAVAISAQEVGTSKSHLNPQSPAPEARIVVATQGSLNNTYISVRNFMDFFETDSIGGNNKQNYATRKIIVEWGGQLGMETDIDGHHKSLRNRGLVAQFMRDSGLAAGDRVEISRLAPYRYKLTRLPPE